MNRQERFDTPGKVELTVDNKLGEVRLITHAAPVTEIDVRVHGPRDDEVAQMVWVEHQNSDGAHRVRVEVPDLADSSWRRLVNVAITVRLPEGATVEVRTVAGSITAEGSLGPARTETTSGDISVCPVDGDLEARSTSGDVRVASVTGAAEVVTVSGDVRCGPVGKTGRVKSGSGGVEVGSVRENLTVETVSGDVTVGRLHDGCDLKTVSGDQQVRQLDAGLAQFKTVSGDLTVSIARRTAVMVDAQSLSGSLSSEIDLSSDEPGVGWEPGPHAEVRARSVSGDVRIQRARA